PSAPGTHNFRIGSSENFTQHQPDSLRVAFLEYQIAELKLQLSFFIQENHSHRSQVVALQFQIAKLQLQVTELQFQVEVQQVAMSISNEEFMNQISANDQSP
ncbi:7159_t:CDS:1, partial [Scutellospora calospora]